MTTEYAPGAEGLGSAPQPRTVARGSKLQIGYLGLDSLYLVIEYPHDEVFRHWSSFVGDVNDPHLYEGIPAEGFVLRRGGLGYPLSVWDGDARLFITDRVEDRLTGTIAEGQGMGLMLQLGPKWLVQYGEPFAPNILRSNVFGQLKYFGVQIPESYRVRINRADITLDVINLDIGTFDLSTWQHQWIGYATRKDFHVSAQTGQLEGLSIGTSDGVVRFKAYDKVVESRKRGSYRFWSSVWGLDEDEEVPVTRLEWTVKCYRGRFVDLRLLTDFTFEKFLALLNYASLKWGSLRVPQPEDTNPTRWPLHPLWYEMRGLIDEWSFHYEEFARRDYDFTPDLSDTYLRSVAGWLAGLLARGGLEGDAEGPVSLAKGLSILHREGYSIQNIQERAEKKWQVMSRLAGKGPKPPAGQPDEPVGGDHHE